MYESLERGTPIEVPCKVKNLYRFEDFKKPTSLVTCWNREGYQCGIFNQEGKVLIKCSTREAWMRVGVG